MSNPMTALVKVKDKFDTNHVLRVFIDMGSGGALISERAAQVLSLTRKNENVPLTGVDDTPLGNAKTSMEIQVQSIVNDSFVKSCVKSYIQEISHKI